MKKLFALLLALVMVLALVGCGGTAAPAKEDPKNDTPTEAPSGESEITGSRALAFNEKYSAEAGYSTTYRSEDGEITIAVLGDNKRLEVTTAEDSGIFIQNADGIYVLYPAEKLAAKLDEFPEEIDGTFDDTELPLEYTTGEMEIDGKTYYYEEFTEEGDTVRYCFEPDGDTPCYIIQTEDGKTYQTEVADLMLGIDESYFALPDGYTFVDVNG